MNNILLYDLGDALDVLKILINHGYQCSIREISLLKYLIEYKRNDYTD